MDILAKPTAIGASAITGIVPLAKGGTGSNLAATGGSSFVLRQNALGANVSVSQLAFADISGSASAGQIPSLDASKITTGEFVVSLIPDLPASIIVSGEFDVARIPDLDASIIVTGTFDESLIPDLDASIIITGTFDTARIPDLDTSKLTSGLLALARGGTHADLSGSGGSGFVLKQSSSGADITVAALVASDIPSLDTSKITSGQLIISLGGTGSDLTLTGGASQVLKQTNAGGNITVSQLSFADISGVATASQIPSLDVSKITTGTFDNARVNWESPGQLGLTVANTVAATTFTTTSTAVFGGSSPVGLVYIDGLANQAQLTIDAHSSQTANIQQWRNSAGTVLAVLTPLGHFGVGNSTPTNASFRTVEAWTDISATTEGIRLSPSLVITASSAVIFRGGGVDPTLNHGTFNYTTTMRGWHVSPITAGTSGTISLVVGMSTSVQHGSAGTLTRGTALRVEQVFNTGGGSIGTATGIQILDQTAGGVNVALESNAGLFIINEGGDPNSDTRIETDTYVNAVFVDASADAIGFGTATPTGFVHIDGATDKVQFTVDAHSTQTTDLVQYRTSAGSVNAGRTALGGLYQGATSMGSGVSRIYSNEVVTDSSGLLNSVQFLRSLTNAVTFSNVMDVRLQAAKTSSAFTGQHAGIVGSAWLLGTNTQNWTGSGGANQLGLVGINAHTEIRTSASGVIGWINGLVSDADFNSVSTATLTNYVGIKVLQPANATSLAGFTNNYGIYIGDFTAGINDYAFVSNAGQVIINFGGDPNSDFNVRGDTDNNTFFVDVSADTVIVGAATVSDSAKFYVNGKISTSGELEINGALNHDGSTAGFFATDPVVQQTMGVATATLVYTAVEQGMIQTMWNLLRAYGLGT